MLWAPPPVWSGSLRSPPRHVLPLVWPAPQRHVPGHSALLLAAGSVGGRHALLVAGPLGTLLPQRLLQAQSSLRAPAQSACGQHQIWGGRSRATRQAHSPTDPHHPSALFWLHPQCLAPLDPPTPNPCSIKHSSLLEHGLSQDPPLLPLLEPCWPLLWPHLHHHPHPAYSCPQSHKPGP